MIGHKEPGSTFPDFDFTSPLPAPAAQGPDFDFTSPLPSNLSGPNLDFTSPLPGIDYVRGSSDVPETPEGRQQADDMGRAFAARGGVDLIIGNRGLQRVAGMMDGIARWNPDAAIIDSGEVFDPWHLGGLEGQPTEDVLPEMQRLIKDAPDETPPGRGARSTADGESFNHFKGRWLSGLRTLMRHSLRQPSKKIALVTHYRGLKLAESWARAGMPANDGIHTGHMLEKGTNEPGSVLRLAPHKSDKWSLSNAHLRQSEPLKPGIYITRHGKTAWNGHPTPTQRPK